MTPERKAVPLTKEQWIERYGGQDLLNREGLEVVPCYSCEDPICHEWRVVRPPERKVALKKDPNEKR